MSKNYILGSITSGILIGIGTIVCSQIQPLFLGALLFSFGLLSIIKFKIPLYTGRIGLLNDRWLPLMLILNLVGITSTALLYSVAFPSFIDVMKNSAEIKFGKDLLSFLIAGIFCGILIHIAVMSKNQIITFLSVVIFILIGAEHCIAIFPYLVFSFSFANLVKFLMVVVGNSIGAIVIENLIGKHVRDSL